MLKLSVFEIFSKIAGKHNMSYQINLLIFTNFLYKNEGKSCVTKFEFNKYPI